MVVVPTGHFQILRSNTSRPMPTVRHTRKPPRAADWNGAVPGLFTILQCHGGLDGCVVLS